MQLLFFFLAPSAAALIYIAAVAFVTRFRKERWPNLYLVSSQPVKSEAETSEEKV